CTRLGARVRLSRLRRSRAHDRYERFGARAASQHRLEDLGVDHLVGGAVEQRKLVGSAADAAVVPIYGKDAALTCRLRDVLHVVAPRALRTVLVDGTVLVDEHRQTLLDVRGPQTVELADDEILLAPGVGPGLSCTPRRTRALAREWPGVVEVYGEDQ